MTLKARAELAVETPPALGVVSTHSCILDPFSLTADRFLKCCTFVIEIPQPLWVCNYLNACFLKLWVATYSKGGSWVLKNFLKQLYPLQFCQVGKILYGHSRVLKIFPQPAIHLLSFFVTLQEHCIAYCRCREVIKLLDSCCLCIACCSKGQNCTFRDCTGTLCSLM
jgi:hypothetical protein